MKLTAHLPADRREHVQTRLRGNLMAWLTTVSPTGKPESVPVWFLLREEDETVLVYSQPGKPKLRNVEQNPQVVLALDVTDLGRDIISLDGQARVAPEFGPADKEASYRAKYTERIGAMFGDAERFGAIFSVPLLITPRRLRA
jgi:PPOX class probable F420-dependent enzyme